MILSDQFQDSLCVYFSYRETSTNLLILLLDLLKLYHIWQLCYQNIYNHLQIALVKGLLSNFSNSFFVHLGTADWKEKGPWLRTELLRSSSPSLLAWASAWGSWTPTNAPAEINRWNDISCYSPLKSIIQAFLRSLAN